MIGLKDTLSEIGSRLAERGYDVRDLIFAPPASDSEVDALERDLAVGLPPSLRTVLLEVSGHVEFRWFLPDGIEFPAPFHSNFCGDLHWSIEFARENEGGRKGWVREVYPDPQNEYDAVWHDKLAFYEVGNGDLLAFDLDRERYENIVYLSHDGGDGHGFVLADNMLDLLVRWTPLACTGGEDWQWLPFTAGPTSRIDPDCENARVWKKLMGLV